MMIKKEKLYNLQYDIKLQLSANMYFTHTN